MTSEEKRTRRTFSTEERVAAKKVEIATIERAACERAARRLSTAADLIRDAVKQLQALERQADANAALALATQANAMAIKLATREA